MLISASKKGSLYYINYPDLTDYYSVTDNIVTINHVALNSYFMVFCISYQNNTVTLYDISSKTIINHYETCDSKPPIIGILTLYPYIIGMGTDQGVICAYVVPTKVIYLAGQTLNGYPVLGSQTTNSG
jgi:hypothetical protein